MTPEEKVKQMEKLLPFIKEIGFKWIERNFLKTIVKTKYFPTCYTRELDLSSHGMGKWTMVYVAESKSNVRKGIVAIRAYQKFYVSHSKNPSNNGVGIYECLPDDYGHVECVEYSPHYFNRIRERMIEPKGIVQPSFDDLVKRVICDHFYRIDDIVTGGSYEMNDNGFYDWVPNDLYDRKDGFKNLVGYHEDGLTLGVFTRGYKSFLTYVPNSMLYQKQIDKKSIRMTEIAELKLRLRYNPFYKFEKKTVLSTDGEEVFKF